MKKSFGAVITFIGLFLIGLTFASQSTLATLASKLPSNWLATFTGSVGLQFTAYLVGAGITIIGLFIFFLRSKKQHVCQ